MIVLEPDGYVLSITFDRDPQRNSLTAQVCTEVANAIDAVDFPGTRAVLIRGRGKAFCAGADLKGGVYGDDFHGALHRMLRSILDCPVPVIADVQGPAVGAGTQLALACDLRVVGDAGWFRVPPAELGFALDNWTIRRAVSMLGGSVARSVLLAAETVDADLAEAVGFANARGDADDALAYAQRIAGFAPLALRQLKGVLNDEGFGFALRPIQQELYERCWSSADAAEARSARAEKRAPVFKGQ
ncbi:enoyl-CoA hydratase [Corynebacterium sp.]|uniref:enoyl-CoA hydratase n=1 Tax=Corynebacterium sp. TaxID=1720 RepID=UPI0026DA7018|nr:enoyl-CoA hydratase [Corynebacterium sp.]MDO5076283.1 enoyl-CoA hydratase [Corynebacterium sp.]